MDAEPISNGDAGNKPPVPSEQAEQLLLAPERRVAIAERPTSAKGEADVFLAPKRVFTSDGTSYAESNRPAKPDMMFDQQAPVPPDDVTVLPNGFAAEPKSLNLPAQHSGALSLVDFSPSSKRHSQPLSVKADEAEPAKGQQAVVDISTRRPPSFNTIIPSLARQTKKISQKTSSPVPPTPCGPAVGGDKSVTQTARTSLPPFRQRRAIYDTLSLFMLGLQRRKKAVATRLNTAFLLRPARIIKDSLIHSRRLAVYAGRRFLQVSRQVVLALENGIQHADRRLLIVARQVPVSARPVLAAAFRVKSKARDFTSQILTSVKNRAKSLKEIARSPRATAKQHRDGAAKSAQRSKVFAWMQLTETGAMALSVQTMRAATNNVITQVKATPALRRLAQPFMAFSLSDTFEKAGFPEISRSYYWAFTGVAVAFIMILFAIMAPKGTAPLDASAGVFPIMDQPGEISDAPKSKPSTLLPIDDPFLEITADAVVSRPGEPGKESAAGVLKWLKANEGLSQFTKAAEIVGLKNLLETGGPYTIFIPDDSAFTKLAPGALDRLLEPAEHARLLNLLVHHIVDERLTLFDIAGRVQEVTSLAGQQVTIDATNIIRVGEAGVINTDLLVGDFVVHVIDNILDVANP